MLFQRKFPNLKTRITAGAAILVANVKTLNQQLRSFSQSPDAASAQNLANQTPVFENRNFLQIRAESSGSSAQREAAVIAESCCLTTSIALCHCQDPFLQNNTIRLLRAKSRLAVSYRGQSPRVTRLWEFLPVRTNQDSTTGRIHLQASRLIKKGHR